MRWHLALVIRLWFLLISQDSATSTNEECSSIPESSPESTSLSLMVVEITTMLTRCFCEITRGPLITVSSVCLFNQCLSCQSDSSCTSSSCFCTEVALGISGACNLTSATRICPPGSDSKYSCQTSTNFALDLSTKPPADCNNGQNTEDFVLVLKQKVPGHNNEESDSAFLKVMCNARSATKDKSTSWNYVSATTTAEIEYQPDIQSPRKRDVIIGVVVGVGGAVLITVIAIVVVVLRRRRAESNNLHGKITSQSIAPVSSETGYASYTTPVSAAYDNATNGTTLNYESIVYDNEEVGESNHAYTEVTEINDHNDYDNSEVGRSDTYSMCKETGKDYEIVSEDQSANIENETTVIDNEFYG